MRSLAPLPFALLLLLSLYGCSSESVKGEPLVCTAGDPLEGGFVPLFGAPNAGSGLSGGTGLSGEQCNPGACICNGKAWVEPVYTEADVEALLSWELSEPFAELTEDPYVNGPTRTPTPDEVCAVMPEGSKRYHLETFASAAEAIAAGGQVTHMGACGLCSTLEDLAVYMGRRELTGPVRQCGIDNFRGDETVREKHIMCLEDLGFTRACAQIWYWNTLHTRFACEDSCIKLLRAPYHTPDGALNECIQCDEDMSGDVFKEFAGRTRRNTGLSSELCRPCDQVRPIIHQYQ